MSSKNVLVTGGTRGIGLAIARKFQQEGYNVTVTGRSKPERSEAEGFQHLIVDFLNNDSIDSFLHHLRENPFDIVINNAGINKIGPIAEFPIEDWRNILEVNLNSIFQITKAVVPSMKKNSFGRIVNITSIFGHVSKEFRAPYSSSKFALLGLTKSTAIELADKNILCNCVAPGFIDTELTRNILSKSQMEDLVSKVPMKRLGKPEEIAEAVYFLGSEKNSFITGQSLVADGGFTSA